MLQLRLLGGAGLERDGEAVTGPAAHRHALALLALLACVPSGRASRSKLVGMLWPDVPEQTARNRLSTTVHRLRSTLGDEVLISLSGDLGLNERAIEVDVRAFREAVRAGRRAEAAALYGGPFLDGFWLREAPEFERWAEGERDRLVRSYREVLEELAEGAEVKGDVREAARWWRERALHDLHDPRVTLRLMRALAASGDVVEALRAARRHEHFLRDEVGAEPAPELRALAERLKAEGTAPVGAQPEGEGVGDDDAELDPRSVAVLPLEELGEPGGVPAFSDGLHHDLLARLSGIGQLTVISRTSVLRYRDSTASVPEIARALGVGTIVEGAVQHVGGRVRLNVQVIDARSDRHRWAETYDRELTTANLFDIQSDLAARIAADLQAELGPAERERIVQRPAEEMETYLLHAQGRTHLARRTERGVARAEDYFRRALDTNRNHAAAWAGLAEALAVRDWYGFGSADAPDAAESAIQAARRAVELDPDLAEARTALGIVLAGRQDGPGAIEEFRQAVELQPSNVHAQSWLGWTLLVTGRPELGRGPAERAVRLDPLAPYTRAFLAKLYLALGLYREALIEAEQARRLQPEYEIAHYMEGLALHHQGRHEAAAFALEEAAPLAGFRGGLARSEVWGALAVTHAARGRANEARALLERIESKGDGSSAGLVRAALGDVDGAFATFEQVGRWGAFGAPTLRHFFPDELGPVRDDPRFPRLLERIDASWELGSDERRVSPETPGTGSTPT